MQRMNRNAKILYEKPVIAQLTDIEDPMRQGRLLLVFLPPEPLQDISRINHIYTLGLEPEFLKTSSHKISLGLPLWFQTGNKHRPEYALEQGFIILQCVDDTNQLIYQVALGGGVSNISPKDTIPVYQGGDFVRLS